MDDRDIRHASVEEHEVAPAGRRMRSPEVLIAQHEGMVTTRDRSTDEDGNPVVTEHTRPGTAVMYKPTAHGYEPRTVSGSAIRMLLRQGWYEFCPDCNDQHSLDGVPSKDPNLCAARTEPVMGRICPVCQKHIYDNMRFSEEAEASRDPNVIPNTDYQNTTPDSRTKAALDLHLWTKHARQAQMMGVPSLPGAMRDMVEEAKPV